jgi:methylmalonyl-CoA mutase, C-terminal domain
MENDRKIRVLIAKLGLDGHDRGAKVVARVLRDAGLEVIYTGIRQTPEMIVAAAVQEDVDVIGLSSLSGAHMELFPEIIKGLAKKGRKDRLFICGGIIPDEDIPRLKKTGVDAVFGPGTSTKDIADHITSHFNH